jgi:hypothetical protein
MQWKITDIHAKNGMITTAKYHVTNGIVDTEGYWHFSDCGSTPFEQITEEMVIDWIKNASMKDGKNIIESRIEEQSDQPQRVIAPWLPQTFTPDL